jgi:hypothetical protein
MGETSGGLGGTAMMVLAYGAIWVILLAFVLRGFALLGGLRREVEELRRVVDERLPSSRSDADNS